VSGVVEMPEDKVISTMKLSGRHVSVDAPFNEDEDNSLLDVMENKESPDTDAGLTSESLKKEIHRTLNILSERERNVIELFYGIGRKEMSLEEIGEQIGLSRERTRQIKEKAIRRLQRTPKNKLLKSYLG